MPLKRSIPRSLPAGRQCRAQHTALALYGCRVLGVDESVWVRQGAPELAICGLSGGEALASPDASDAVRVENLVHADDRHLLDKALRNNQAVKGIFVVKWKFGGENDMLVGHIKK